MNKIAKVTRLIDDQTAEVVAENSNCAGGCSNCTGCALLSSGTIVADNSIRARLGDTVVIESDSRHILRLAATAYLLPAVLFAAGAVVSSIASILGAITGLGAAFLLNCRIKRNGGAAVYIAAILEKEKC